MYILKDLQSTTYRYILNNDKKYQRNSSNHIDFIFHIQKNLKQVYLSKQTLISQSETITSINFLQLIKPA